MKSTLDFVRRRILPHLRSFQDKFNSYTRFKIPFKIAFLLPLAVYLSAFSLVGAIPHDDRPDIDVKTLPTIERAITFNRKLQYWPRTVIPESYEGLLATLDLLAAFVYLIHFGGVWIFALVLYFFNRKKKMKNGFPIPQPYLFLFVL